jgi:hypothetical protein
MVKRFFRDIGASIAVAVALASCGDVSPSAPDAGSAGGAALLGAPRIAAQASTDGVIGEAQIFDETVTIPWLWYHTYYGAASDGGRHYLLTGDRLDILEADGVPHGDRGVALPSPVAFGDPDETSVATGDGRLAIAYGTGVGALRLRLYRVVDDEVADAPVDVSVHGSPPYGTKEPAMVFGNGMFWVVYHVATSSARYDDVLLRRFRADGIAVDAQPIRLGDGPIYTRPRAAFADGRLIAAWHLDDDVAIVRVAPSGQPIDTSPIVVPGFTYDLALAANDAGIQLIRDGIAQRYNHAMTAIGGPIAYTTDPPSSTLLAAGSGGVRLAWQDGPDVHVRAISDGGELSPDVVVTAAGPLAAVTVGRNGETLVVHNGTGVHPPAVTRLAADGSLLGRDVLRVTARRDHSPRLVASAHGLYAFWTREAANGRYADAMAPVDDTGARLAPALDAGPYATWYGRGDGFWALRQRSAQAVNSELVPVADAVDLGRLPDAFVPLDGAALITYREGATLVGRRLGPMGFLDAAPFPIAGGISNHHVAAGRDEWLLTWCTNTALRAARISAQGVLRDITPLEIPVDSSGCQTPQAIHMDGDDYAVVWDGLGLEVARLSAGVFSTPFRLDPGDGTWVSADAVRLLKDGDETVIVTRLFRTGGRILRLRGDGTQVPGAVEHDINLARFDVVVTGPGRALLLHEGTASDGSVMVPRIVRREVALGAAGNECSVAAACGSGHCADGVCCDQACGADTSDCAACSVAAGAAVDGRCGPRVAGAVCRPASGGCDGAEVCDGKGTACPVDAPALDDTACDDGLRCTDGDVCRAGACVGEAVVCPALDECHVGECDQGLGCQDRPVSDGSPCGDGGSCRAGTCVAPPGADAGLPDAGIVDAGVPDAGRSPPDAAAPDAVTVDAPPSDAGSSDDDSGCRASRGASPLGALVALALLVRHRRRRFRICSAP